MNKIRIRLLSLMTLVLACLCTLTSCVDDILPGLDDGEIDGSMRTLSVELSFQAEDEQELKSRAATDVALAGNSIQNINHLRILIYNAETGSLWKNMVIVNGGLAVNDDIITNVKYTKDSDNRLPDEKDDGYHDDASGKVTFDISLPSANYYMYAVANAADLTADRMTDRHTLKNTPRRWITGNIAENSEMFGIFSPVPNRHATDDVPLSVTNKMTGIHCWLRRLASKVTVAFDGTELFDNVQVYIDSISLFDIPQQCLLGSPNKAGRDYGKMDAAAMLPIDAATRYRSGTNGLIYHGAYDLVQNLSNLDGQMLLPSSFYHVSNVVPYLGKGSSEGREPEDISKRHAYAAKSLFFYENVQGTGDRSKKQDADGDNVIDRPNWIPNQVGDDNSWKDAKPYGTYVQVHGQYRSTSFDGTVSSGPIVYRFMLGKDTDMDFNAERNTHYKLTLKLKGYGNDADWHIEYEQKRGIMLASPQFISYLYNKKMMASVKVTGKMPPNSYLRAEIEEDPAGKGFWMPWGDGVNFPKAAGGSNGSGVYWNGAVTGGGRHNGFLSLSQTNVISIEYPGWEGVPTTAYDNIDYWNFSKDYFEGSVDGHNHGVRDYSVVPRETGYDSNAVGQQGMYFVSALSGEGDNITERHFSIPLYTRAKTIVGRSGHTGNNPYFEYARKQRVKFTVVTNNVVNKDFEPAYLDVIQVPRLENPKGIWRSDSNNDPFHVTLMQLQTDESTFAEFNSIGKWSAEVINGSNAPIITLSTTDKGSGAGNVSQTNVSRIEGESESPIDFIINFTGAKGFAAIKVRYHNYTCEHDIFCCKGYEDPVDVVGDGKQKWSSFNVHHFENGKAIPTKSPLQEGSYFRRGNPTAILASNNHMYGMTVKIGNNNLDVIRGDGTAGKSTWDNITVSNATSTLNNYQVNAWTISNPNEHIATMADFYTLLASTANDINFPIKMAYGVLYGDGADRTQSTASMAFGYDDENGGPSSKGMRGVFIYNSKSMRQIFLPIGFAGHGRRKNSVTWQAEGGGTLRYSGRTGANTNVQKMPLFYDLYRRHGAIYWSKYYYQSMPENSYTLTWKDDNGVTQTKKQNFADSRYSTSLDINYFTFGFEGYANNSAGTQTNTDACFIRTVFGAEAPGSTK